MHETIRFSTREKFREWLRGHCLSDDGIGLLFSKTGEPETITAAEALEEALCFGWIDCRIKRLIIKLIRNIFPFAGKKQVVQEK